MSKAKDYKDSSMYLKEIRAACQKISAYVKRTTRQEFIKQLESYDAICMQFSHMGEQVSLLEKHSDKIISHFPDEVDWPAIKALRNRIDHAYATLDADLIWKFAIDDVSAIEQSVTRLLKKRYGI